MKDSSEIKLLPEKVAEKIEALEQYWLKGAGKLSEEIQLINEIIAESDLSFRNQEWFKKLISKALSSANKDKHGLLTYLLGSPVNCSLEDIEKILSTPLDPFEGRHTLLTYAASLSETYLLEKLLTERPLLNLNEKDSTGRTALETAVSTNADYCFQLLIEKQPGILTTPIETNETIASLIDTAVYKPHIEVLNVLLNKINNIAPSKFWLTKSWFKELVITGLLGKKGDLLASLLLPPANCSITDIESLMPAASQRIEEQQMTVEENILEPLKQRNLMGMVPALRSRELLDAMLKSSPSYSLTFFTLMSGKRRLFPLDFILESDLKIMIANMIFLAEKNVDEWKKELPSVSDTEKHELNYKITMIYYWLSVANTTPAFYITLPILLDEYVKASQYFSKAENLFRSIPIDLTSRDNHERKILITNYQKLISKTLLREIESKDIPIQSLLSILPEHFLNFQKITSFHDISAGFQDTTYAKLSLSNLNSLKDYIERTNLERIFDEYNFKKPGFPPLSAKDIQNKILGFLFPIATPKSSKVEEKKPTSGIVNSKYDFKQEMNRFIPIYIYRMAKVCAEKLSLGFNTKDIQEMLDTALWQQRKQRKHNLTILNYAELQKYLLNAIELWKDFISGKKLSREQARIQLSACLTQAVTRYLNHQQLIKALVIEAQGDRNSTYDQCLRQALIEGLMWHLRYMPHSELKQASSQLTNHLQKKLAQCKWEEVVSGKFFAPPKTTGLKLVYGNQLLFPGNPKALAQFMFAVLPVVINNKKQFKALLTTHPATSNKRKKHQGSNQSLQPS
jgi:hypothetical protein